MKITQVELVNKKGRHLFCWLSGLEGKRHLKVGHTLNLDGDDKNTLWEIVNIWGTQEYYDIRRSWHAGGL